MMDLSRYRTHDITKGFVLALIGQDLMDIASAWIDFDKPMYGAINDNLKTDEVDVVQLLSEHVYKEGSDIFEISENEEMPCMIYKSDECTVLFIIKNNWSIAIWNE